ncbi:hypothetical protein IIY66_00650 [Candidatus Saccharibacteria bacterium]|nr:hypothetical protein [Candidatus Saccharibacteria bacterium]
MAQKAKAKPTNNKNLIISACIAVVVVAVVAVAIFFATRGPQLNDSYFVSDGSKYVVAMDSEDFASDGITNAPVKAYAVYTYSGDKITGMITYAEFANEATAKAALEEYKKVSLDGVKSISTNGKYVVIEMSDDQYSDMTASELKAYIDFINNASDSAED